MSILPPSNAFLVLTRFATFLLRVRIRSYMNTQLERVNSAGAAWRSCLLRMEWSGLPVWWAEREEWLWRNTATGWCQATTAMRMVAATRPFRYTLGWALFLLLSVFDCMAMESQCCLVCKYYNDSQCIATSPLELLFFISFLTQNNFFYFSFDATYYIAFHTLVAPNIMFNFHWCCMLQSFSCVLRLLYHLYAYYRYSGCHAKIGNFIAEKFDVPHIALK